MSTDSPFNEELRYRYVTAVIRRWVRSVNLPRHCDIEPLIQEGAIAFERKWAEIEDKTLCSKYALSAAIDELRRTHSSPKRRKRWIKFIPLENTGARITRSGFKDIRPIHGEYDSEMFRATIDPTDYFGFDPFLHNQLVEAILNLNPKERKVLVDWLNSRRVMDTAEEINISSSRVVQIRNRAFQKIRNELDIVA